MNSKTYDEVTFPLWFEYMKCNLDAMKYDK